MIKNRFSGSNTRKEVVTGGMKNLLKTWDIETGKRVWGARNVSLSVYTLLNELCYGIRVIPRCL